MSTAGTGDRDTPEAVFEPARAAFVDGDLEAAFGCFDPADPVADRPASQLASATAS